MGKEGRRDIWLAFVPLALVCALALARFTERVFVATPINYNEGWNAFHALAAASAGRLYPPAESLVVNNYPPLSFYVVGLAGLWLGDNILAGRLIALAAFLAVIALVALVAHRLGADTAPATFAAAVLAAQVMLQLDQYVGMNDPQMLAHAVAMLGLWLCVSPREGPVRPALGGLLLALACFVKHTLVALPVALALWQFVHHRRRLVAFLAGFGASAAAIGGAVLLHFGVDFVRGIGSGRGYRLLDVVPAAYRWLLPMQHLLAAPLFLVAVAPREPAAHLVGAYALLGLGFGLLFVGGEGVGLNALLDGMIGASLAYALLLARLPRGLVRAVLAGSLAVLALLVVSAAKRDHLRPSRWLASERAQAGAIEADLAFLRSRGHPVICNTPALCYWAGKAFVVDPFNAAQAFKTGRLDEARLLADVRARRFAVIQVDPAARVQHSSRRFSDAFMAAVRECYVASRESQQGTFYEPAPTGPATSGGPCQGTGRSTR